MDPKSISILVIDGDAASRNYLVMVLGKSGYTILSASLGREGLVSAWQNQPNLIILDPALPDMKGLELLNRLRQDRRTSGVPCIALSSLDNPQEATSFLTAGCNEYLVKSGEALPRLLELIPRLLQVEAKPKKRGGLIAFLSAKGGLGTSSLCANIAMCMGNDKKVERRIAVMDMVLPIGSIANIVGYADRLNLVTVAMQNPGQTTAQFFKDNLPRVPNWRFNLLAGSPDPEMANQLPASRIEEILDSLLEAYDYVLVDLGRALSRISLPIIQKADVIGIVLGTDLATATLSQAVWEYLKAQGVETQHLFAIQNRAVGLEGLTKAELEQMMGLTIRLMIPYMGRNFTLANNRHEPIVTKFPGDSAAFSLQQAANQIIELCQRVRTR